MTKTSKITIGIILLILLLITSFLVFKYEAGETETETQTPKICCNDTCINLEIATDSESRQLGLMYREYLPDNNGMLFVFEGSGIHPFRMKNTIIPLAGIRLDSDLKIVDIIEMDPCETDECTIYTPTSDSLYVLEINQGLISEKGLIHVGDKCKLINYK